MAIDTKLEHVVRAKLTNEMSYLLCVSAAALRRGRAINQSKRVETSPCNQHSALRKSIAVYIFSEPYLSEHLGLDAPLSLGLYDLLGSDIAYTGCQRTFTSTIQGTYCATPILGFVGSIRSAFNSNGERSIPVS